VNITISLLECKNPVVTQEEIDFYLEKHPKKLKKYVIDKILV